MPPTYSMYSVCTNINDIEVVECPLSVTDNSFQIDEIRAVEILNNDPFIKLTFITSPGNPTGVKIDIDGIKYILENWTNGLVVIEEAYIVFCGGSTAPLVTNYPNLVTLQTLSKSFGLAEIRLSMTFANADLVRILNAMKAPYNISTIIAEHGIKAIQDQNLELMEANTKTLNKEKIHLVKALISIPYVDAQYVGGLDANFILIRINKGDNDLAKKIYLDLATKSGAVIRYRGMELSCQGCLRVTVGTKEENDILIQKFKETVKTLTK